MEAQNLFTEKTFFDTFGIEPKTNKVYGMQLDYHIKEYPQITDHILLELVCILSKTKGISFDGESTIEEIKEYVLKLLKWYRGDSLVNNQVRKLFEEG